MKTTIHTYKFDISNPAEKTAYAELCAKLKSQGLKCFETWGSGAGHYFPFAAHDGETIELETESLFNNQWNADISGKGWRVFDWAQDYMTQGMNKSLKRGHYLAITEEMTAIRRDTKACGYCGKKTLENYKFCPHCLDGEYLTEDQLNLLRMAPICDSDKPRPKLTKAESEYILPLYRNAQLHGTSERGKARIEKAKQEIESTYKAKVKAAKAERDGQRWVIANCPNMLQNHIYYSHTGMHCFGWRNNGLSKEQASILREIMEKAPFPAEFEIKCAK